LSSEKKTVELLFCFNFIYKLAKYKN